MTPARPTRAGDLELIEWLEDGSVELYDLAADIGERHDRSVERPEEAQRLLETLRAWRNEVGADMPRDPRVPG